MDIKELKKDDLTIRVEMNFGKEDYAEKKKKALNKFRREADIKGFRKGMAPMSLVEKMHGQSALVDSVNELISENLNKYITDNNLSIIGEPLPVEDEKNENDWENGESFKFDFEIALAPKVEFTLSKEDKIPFYEVSATAKAKAEYKANILKQYGTLENCEVVKDEDFVVANLVQGETKVEKTYISLKSIKDDAVKGMFIGKKVGDSFDIDVNVAFPNESDRAAMLNMKKEELANVEPLWNLTIAEIKNYVDAKPGQALYEQLFGKETEIATDEEFDTKLVDRMVKEFESEVDYRFMLDARNYLMQTKTDIKLPEDFMKRWLFYANEGKFKMEEIEKEFPAFIEDFRWQSIVHYIMKEQKLQVTKEALTAQALQLAQYQFASYYGINSVPEEYLKSYAENMLKDEKTSQRLFEKVEQDMVVEYVRSVVTLEKKKISTDKLREMNEQKTK